MTDVQKIADEVESVDDHIFSGRGNGVLHLAAAHPPVDGNVYADDHYIGVDFNHEDWASIFLETLHCSQGEPYVAREDINEQFERNRQLFRQSIPEYPLLGRIFDMFEDYSFGPEEIRGLREECLKVKAIASNPAADLGLRKLIYACDEASKRGLHLLFSCD